MEPRRRKDVRALGRFVRWFVASITLLLSLGQQAPARAQLNVAPPVWPPIPNTPSGSPFGFALPLNCVALEPFGINLTSQNIPDYDVGTHQPGVVTSTIQITPSVPYIWTVVAITSITHTASGDLNINLISPAGTVVTLAHHLGALHANVFSDTFWSDYANVAATEADYSSPQSFLIPEEAMGAFQGQSGAGTWSLVVSDDFPVDTGQLRAWELVVAGFNEAPITRTYHLSAINGGTIPAPGSLDTEINVGTFESNVVSATLTTNISHPDPSQLTIQLTSPQGLTTTISNHEGFDHADWFAGTQWYDKAGDAYPPGPVAMDASIYPSGTLTAAVPEGAMGHFSGSDPNGLWDLHIANDTSGAAGTLNSWGLDVTTGHCIAHNYLPVVRR